MVALPNFDIDPTLEAINAAIEKREAERPVYKRNLGVGKLGDECERKVYYHINDFPAAPAEASLIYAGQDGHVCEAVMADRLRLVPGIDLWTHTDAGKQFGFKDMDGRLKGYADGVILGLLQAPASLHVWENKAKSVKLFNEFQKIKEKHGEKNTLKEWNFEYFVQAQMLMGYSKFLGSPDGDGPFIDRHYMTVTQQGARAMDSCRTEFDRPFFEAQKKKAARLIAAKSAPVRISEFRSFWKCKTCEFADICWGKQK
jgi:hypothetical protein